MNFTNTDCKYWFVYINVHCEFRELTKGNLFKYFAEPLYWQVNNQIKPIKTKIKQEINK